MKERHSLEEMFVPLSELAPPEAVRRANRHAVRKALEHPTTVHWWQRSIAVPLPTVFAIAVILLVSLSTHLFRLPGVDKKHEDRTVEDLSGVHSIPSTTLVASTNPYIEYFETQRYISGVGVFDQNIVYQIKE